MKYLAVLLLLSGCATSNYKQGCLDGLNEAFTGPWTEWQETTCEKLDQQRLEKIKAREALDRQYGRGR